jgi:hypothetical protein
MTTVGLRKRKIAALNLIFIIQKNLNLKNSFEIYKLKNKKIVGKS